MSSSLLEIRYFTTAVGHKIHDLSLNNNAAELTTELQQLPDAIQELVCNVKLMPYLMRDEDYSSKTPSECDCTFFLHYFAIFLAVITVAFFIFVELPLVVPPNRNAIETGIIEFVFFAIGSLAYFKIFYFYYQRRISQYGDFTPLHLACLSGNYEAAEVLLKYGANVDAQTSVCNGAKTALHFASEVNDIRIIDLLLKHDANLIPDAYDNRPTINRSYHYAVRNTYLVLKETKCEISNKWITDPVVCSDGYTYERSTIVPGIVSPRTGQPIHILCDNLAVKEWLDKYSNEE